MSVSVKATVRVVLEVEADSTWDGKATFEQIAKQAENSVRGLFLNNNEVTLREIPRSVKSLEMVSVRVYPTTG